ncbi:MAG: DUF4829 domain-containing protein [Syntrophomonas sp.]|nr:DUF4829 domain-containing protein [Syntrophomonas sp.]
MKKLITIACLVLVCLVVLILFYLNANVTIDIGESTKFSKEEVQTAVNCVIENFEKNFQGCDLKKLWYDEEKSNSEIASYMSFGRGSVNGVKEENVIILFSNFYVNGTGGPVSLNPHSPYNGWNWILIRDGKTGNWKIDDSGY